MSSTEIKLGADQVTKISQLGNMGNEESKPTGEFFKEISKSALFDTGILPLAGTGVLAIRNALNHMQVVFQHEPMEYYINWGKYEGEGKSGKAPTYHLAQPYRIVIGDFVDGSLLGARTFYSPYPVQTGDAPLYHVNLPNINCKGYGGNNGVGWICLYHKGDNWVEYTTDQKIRRLVERASGVETYNDANMSQTDGPRFYKEKYTDKVPANELNKYGFLWDPATWQAKTEKEGWEWTLDEDLWLPVLVKDMDHQEKHYPEGQPLTLDMAMLGSYSAYYTDKYLPKPVNAFAREDLADPDDSAIFETFNKAFLSSGTKLKPKAKAKGGPLLQGQAVPVQPVAPVVTTYHCPDCAEEVPNWQTNEHKTVDGVVCDGCWAACYHACASCVQVYHYDQLQSWGDELYCFGCKMIYTCQNCGTQHDAWGNLFGEFCIQCTTVVTCNSCGAKGPEQEVHKVEAKASLMATNDTLFNLCLNCFEKSVICGCGLLKSELETGKLGDGQFACEPCIEYTNDGVPFYSKCEAANPAADIPEYAVVVQATKKAVPKKPLKDITKNPFIAMAETATTPNPYNEF